MLEVNAEAVVAAVVEFVAFTFDILVDCGIVFEDGIDDGFGSDCDVGNLDSSVSNMAGFVDTVDCVCFRSLLVVSLGEINVVESIPTDNGAVE